MKLSDITNGFKVELSEITDKQLILDVQRYLVNAGYLKNNQIDGIIGKITLDAFAKFKKNNFLEYPTLLGFSTVQELLNHKIITNHQMPTNGVGWVSSPFGKRGSGFHKGVDIAANTGVEVFAINDGVINYVSSGCKIGDYNCGGGYGNCVYIDHANSIQTRYAHLSTSFVKTGQQVMKGKVIGTVGNTGHSFGSHLHFEYRISGNPVNSQLIMRVV